MLRKIISLSLVAVILSVTAFASADVAVFTAAYAADANETSVFSYAANEIDFVTETTSAGSAKHEPVETLPTWDGTTAVTPDTDENGTYLISSAEELAGFATLVNTKGETSGTYDNCAINAKLDRDINMSGQNWASFAIGGKGTTSYVKTDNGYTGDFDGQGHNIYNFKYSATSSSTEKHGLFSAVGSGGSIKNLNLIDVDYEVGSNSSYGTVATGILCGSIAGTDANSPARKTTNPTTISNVYISGNASLIGGKKIGIYGSVAGYVSLASVENCVSSVNVNFEGQAATIPQKYSTSSKLESSNLGIGGIVGAVGDGWSGLSLISNCGNLGAVYAPANRRVGGVVGAYQNCSDHSNRVGARDLWNKGNITGYGQVAGVIGFIYKPNPDTTNTPFKNWYNTGDVTAVQAENAYAAGVYTSREAKKTKGYFCSTGDVKIAVTDAETGNVTESFDSTCGLIVAASDTTVTSTENQLYRSDLKTKYTADTTVGTGKTIAEIQAMTAADMDAVLGAGYVADCGINGGLPILSAQLENLVLDEETYEVADSKSLTVKVDEAGYVALKVTAIIEGSALTATPKDGEAYNVTVPETGIVMLPTNGATEITVSAAEGNRFLIKEVSDLSLAELEATAIKATFASDESATIILALFNKTDNKLKTCKYAPYTVVTDGKISAVIDLTADDVSGCELRAYVWANDTLVPLRANVEVID